MLCSTTWESATRRFSKAVGVPPEWVVTVPTGGNTYVSREAVPIIMAGAAETTEKAVEVLKKSAQLMK